MSRKSALCTVLALLWSLPATAASITWSAPVRITSADETLGFGRVYAAVHFSPLADIEVKLANKTVVRFQQGARVQVAELTQGSDPHAGLFAFKGSGNDAFDRVLSGGATEGGGDTSGTLTLRGLVPGKRYAVQLFAIDMRGRDGCGGDITDCRQRAVDFGDGQGHFSKRVLEGTPSYVLGSFTADTPSQAIIVRGWQVNAEGREAWTLNAVVIYERP
jgi:hypothetical protein